ncbi:putative MAPEG superfamily protein [Dyella sp. SG562]|uniref:MAPEG family protein n=1 Tax=Dyella TaxID=231454 RepID=UPI00141FBDA6|nr:MULTISPECIES: MAPEG family protein [unclassified Dyella]NII75576.1 putative MAPEG superfamily protein [Dyella sp. SG562]NKJ23509.1 putative MAPEG superfamily protein [Dyella sp. SG609]
MFQHLPAVVVLLTVLLQCGTAYAVGRARALYGVKAPATSGHPLFERAFRVQMNTLESTLMFLPALWLAATYGAPLWSGIAGLVWVLGRVWYAVGYLRDPARREGGFIVAAVGLLAVLGMGAIGLGKALLLG